MAKWWTYYNHLTINLLLINVCGTNMFNIKIKHEDYSCIKSKSLQTHCKTMGVSHFGLAILY